MKVLLMILIISCQGYRFQKEKNPFKKYNINSIYVTNFYNFSNLNNVGAPFTREMAFMLSSFSGLKIVNNLKNADAAVVGILSSDDKRTDSRVRADEINAKSILKDRVGSNRSEYIIPTKTILNVNLKVMIIRKMGSKDIEILKSEGQIIDPRVVITETIPLTEVYTREVLAGSTNNFTTTRAMGAERNTIEEMAKSASSVFKEMILYAF